MKSFRYYTLLLTGALLIGTMTQTAHVASAISLCNVANKAGAADSLHRIGRTQDLTILRYPRLTDTSGLGIRLQ